MLAGNNEAVSLLIQAGADITYHYSHSNIPHLHMALKQEQIRPDGVISSSSSSHLVKELRTKNNQPKTVPLITPRNKQEDPEKSPNNNFISHQNYVEIVKTLLKNGADPLLPDEHKNTPLHLASLKGSIPMMASILVSQILYVQNNEKKTVLDLWPRDKMELEILIEPLTQVFSLTNENAPIFNLNVNISLDLLDKILDYVDRKTLHFVLPCINHKWRTIYHDHILGKKRKKLSTLALLQ